MSQQPMERVPSQADVEYSTANQLANPTQPVASGASRAAATDDAALNGLLQRISQITSRENTGDQPVGESRPVDLSSEQVASEADSFIPPEPRSIQDASLTESQVEEFILKYLMARGEDSGNGIADQVRLPFLLVEEILRRLKSERLVQYKDTTAVNDYVYSLTDVGRDLARRHNLTCTYFGAAPVSLEDYVESVTAQSLQHQHPTVDAVQGAFDDLLINDAMLTRLGPAINSGRGMFLYGFPGNGKTSIAERITRCFGQSIWIPRAILAEGEIIRIFDPSQHEEMPLPEPQGLVQEQKFDRRWIRVRRPTIIVGGELTMESLELNLNTTTGVSEAPLQLKSNCGTLVIDDFGRQRISTAELLNRWIVPLEKRYDFLNLASGKKIQVPFDQLVVFSTNLEPKDLVDDAFLRRIPYKIEVLNPSEEEFRELFRIMCPILDIEHEERPIDYLIKTHYRPIDRPFRCCQPRDLLMQVRNYCLYQGTTPRLTEETLDFAVNNYFAVM